MLNDAELIKLRGEEIASHFFLQCGEQDQTDSHQKERLAKTISPVFRKGAIWLGR